MVGGINRLGNAPKKRDPARHNQPKKTGGGGGGRFRALDYMPDGVEADADYMKSVQDIEDTQQRHGWLHGRGAFDKGDQLYLRDEQDRQRQAEASIREMEKSSYVEMRARAIKSSSSHHPGSAAAAPKSKAKKEKHSKPALLGRVQVASSAAEEPAAKRPRVDGGAASPGGSARAAQEGGACPGGGGAGAPAANGGHEGDSSEGEGVGGGLLGLGGYDSEDEPEEALPTAVELLGGAEFPGQAAVKPDSPPAASVQKNEPLAPAGDDSDSDTASESD